MKRSGLALLAILAGCAEGEMPGLGSGGSGGTPDAHGCVTDLDCNDNDDCTTDRCDRATGTCSHQHSCCVTDSDCDDHKACTMDTCKQGGDRPSCVNTPIPSCCMADSDCDDQNACTMDHCDTASQMCSHTMITGCCTSDLQCDDSDACTQDSCMNMTCNHTAVSGCCTTDAMCDDADPCTSDSCNTSAHVCMHAPVTGCCQMDAQCDDGNLCTTDACNTTSHTCTHNPVSGCCNADGDCNDGNACTTDVCNVGHQCVHTPVNGCCNLDSECNDGNVCTTDTCNTTTHVCAHTGVPSCCTMNSQCDDRNVCNGAETCVNSTCMPGTALNCNDGNACTQDLCDPTAGCQHPAVNCDDGNACTADSCDISAGCQHAAINCDDGDICTVDGCNFSTGCTHSAIANCAPRPNDLCANAQDLGASDANISSSTLGAHDESNPPAACSATAGNGGPDVFYKVTVNQTEWVTFDTFGSSINTVLYILDGCGGNVVLSGAGCNDDSGCNAPDSQTSAIALQLNPGTYIVVVDSFGPGGAGAFNLHVHHSGGTCASAQPINLGTPVSSTTVGQANHTNPGCTPANNAPDKLFLFYLCPITGTFSVEANLCTGTTYDSVVYMRYGTCTAGDLGCDDDGCGIFAGPSDMHASNISTGGGLYFVIVDGYSSSSTGTFTLTVQ